MITQDIQITNRLGLHARPAAMLVQTASDFDCDIKIKKDTVEVNAKSIMGVLMLAAEYGSVLRLQCEGADEKQAAQAIAALFANKFNEEF
ncbi:MAG: HPr family phosphocarrier protein [Elusimicrobiaceae bacterium]|nr:HPr family phosphocarrier protein [Elusimicrobiaceae bacterium]